MPIIVDKDKKRREIIDAAMGVFSRTGYRRTKMNDIAEAAGVGKGTVYEYFRSKEDLFLQMSEHLFHVQINRLEKELEAVREPEEQIRRLTRATLEQAAMWTGIAYLTVDVWSEMDRKGEDDRLRQLMMRLYQTGGKIISRYIRDEQERGALKNFDPDLVTLVLIGALDGLVFQLIVDNNMFDVDAMTDTLTRVLMDGLRK